MFVDTNQNNKSHEGLKIKMRIVKDQNTPWHRKTSTFLSLQMFGFKILLNIVWQRDMDQVAKIHRIKVNEKGNHHSR